MVKMSPRAGRSPLIDTDAHKTIDGTNHLTMSLNLITKEVADAIIKCRTEEKRTKGKKTLHLANGRKKVRLDKFDLIDGASAFDNVRLTHYGKLVVEIDAETFVKIVKQLLVKELARVEEISTSLQQVKKMVITIVNKFFSVNAGQAVSTVDLAALLVAVDAEKSGDTAVVEAYYKGTFLQRDHCRSTRDSFHSPTLSTCCSQSMEF